MESRHGNSGLGLGADRIQDAYERLAGPGSHRDGGGGFADHARTLGVEVLVDSGGEVGGYAGGDEG